MRFRHLFAPLAITLLAILVGGCGEGMTDETPVAEPPPAVPGSPLPQQALPPETPTAGLPAAAPTATVIVTRNFGETAIVSETITLDGETTALDALEAVADVETKYGGAFVRAIEGIDSGYGGESTAAEDWFIYLNGIACRFGAGSYILNPGDVERWDYHDWSFRQFIPALIGDFPEPFVHGYGGAVYPTRVVYQAGWEAEAAAIAGLLAELGVGDVAVRSHEDLTADEWEHCNLIILGDRDFAPIVELNEPWERLGFFTHFEDGVLRVYDAGGAAMGEYGAGTGVIQATQSIWNPDGVGAGENVVWMLSGTDTDGVAAAVRILIERGHDFRYAAAAVVASGDEVIRVP